MWQTCQNWRKAPKSSKVNTRKLPNSAWNQPAHIWLLPVNQNFMQLQPNFCHSASAAPVLGRNLLAGICCNTIHYRFLTGGRRTSHPEKSVPKTWLLFSPCPRNLQIFSLWRIWQTLVVGRTSWNTAGLRMPKRIPNVWAFSAEIQAAGFEQRWRRNVLQSKLLHCIPLHWPLLLLQGGFCRSWAFRGQPPSSQLGRVGTTTGTSSIAFLLFIASDGSIASKNFIQSMHAAFIWKVFLTQAL